MAISPSVLSKLRPFANAHSACIELLRLMMFNGYVLWSRAWCGVTSRDLGGLIWIPSHTNFQDARDCGSDSLERWPCFNHFISFCISTYLINIFDRKAKSWTNSEVWWASSLTGHSWNTASSVLGSVVWVRHCYWPHSRSNVASKLLRIEMPLGAECKSPIWILYLN
jgi:hypothetical protein